MDWWLWRVSQRKKIYIKNKTKQNKTKQKIKKNERKSGQFVHKMTNYYIYQHISFLKMFLFRYTFNQHNI